MEALKYPSKIPSRLISKCKQMLLSPSPIITRTCWNRRFGGDGALCSSSIKLLTHIGLLEEGRFLACNHNNAYVSWLKLLPADVTNIANTLQFQQQKLNIFNVTWSEYAASFKTHTISLSNKSLVSIEAAEILRSKRYQDVGFILNEENILSKNNKCRYQISAQNISFLNLFFR